MLDLSMLRYTYTHNRLNDIFSAYHTQEPFTHFSLLSLHSLRFLKYHSLTSFFHLTAAFFQYPLSPLK